MFLETGVKLESALLHFLRVFLTNFENTFHILVLTLVKLIEFQIDTGTRMKAVIKLMQFNYYWFINTLGSKPQDPSLIKYSRRLNNLSVIFRYLIVLP